MSVLTAAAPEAAGAAEADLQAFAHRLTDEVINATTSARR